MSKPATPNRPESLFPKLKTGPKAMAAAEIAAHQRSRLCGAMVAAVAKHGYPRTTIDELGALAGVSKRDFYALFDSKQACFFAAFEEVTEAFAADVERAVAGATGFRAQLVASIETLAKAIETTPESISLVLIDSLTVGPAADDPRQRSQDLFIALLGSGLERTAGAGPAAATSRSIVVGLRRVAYRTIRDRTGRRLRQGAPALADWVLAYQGTAGAGAGPSTVPTAAAEDGDGDGDGDELSWEEPPDSLASRERLSQRERILRAIAQLVCADTYAKLTIPAISATAGTSNKTFYDEFGSKQEAFLASFDALAESALTVTRRGFDAGSNWSRRAESALGAYLQHLVSNRLFAELAYRELPAMGRPGLERLDAFMDQLAEIFEAGAPGRGAAASAGAGKRDDLVTSAIVGGVWGAIRHEIMSGNRARLATVHPQLLRFVAVGFGSDGAG
jgi:AcrR family transcriptional regulator